MVLKCSLRGCKSTWEPGGSILYHAFPKNPERRKLWLSLVPLKGNFYESAKICSLHFNETDYDCTRKRLRESAVPSYRGSATDSNVGTTVDAASDTGLDYSIVKIEIEPEVEGTSSSIKTEPLDNSHETSETSEKSVVEIEIDLSVVKQEPTESTADDQNSGNFENDRYLEREDNRPENTVSTQFYKKNKLATPAEKKMFYFDNNSRSNPNVDFTINQPITKSTVEGSYNQPMTNSTVESNFNQPSTNSTLEGSFNKPITKSTVEISLTTQNVDGLFKCWLCLRSFSQQRFLTKHIETNHKEIDKVSDQKEQKTSNRKLKYECDICHKKFTRNRQYQSHILFHTGDRPYKCDICKNSYIQKAHLQQHMNCHNGVKLKCNICPYETNLKYKLTTHVKRAHATGKPFECDLCHKRFSVQTYLNNHMGIHTVKKPFECNICQKTFPLKHYLNMHVKRHKAQKVLECDFCGKMFAVKYNLGLHIKFHMKQLGEKN